MSAIRFQHVSKRYDLAVGQGSIRDALSGLADRWIRRNGRHPAPPNTIWALRDVSFEVQWGEILGLVGANGAGKSTVLKLLSKVTYPTSGEISVDGRVSALIELGAGFHPDLTGRENVYLSGAILGLTRREIDEQMESIVDFAELHQFMDTPVKRYSSGMYVRLGFSVAVHVDPQILLVDEVLAVGDAKFQDKCIKRIAEFRRQGKTMVIVSHSRHMLERLCDRALLLHRGQVAAEGPVAQVVDQYYQGNYRDIERSSEAASPSNDCRGERVLEITRVAICDGARRERNSFVAGEPLVVLIHFRANANADDPVFYCDLCQGELLLNGNNNSCQGIATGRFQPGDEGVVEVRYDQLNLLGGEYHVTVGATQDIFTQIKYHVVEKAATFDVSSPVQDGVGVVHMPQKWVVRRESPAPRAAARQPLEMVPGEGG